MLRRKLVLLRVLMVNALVVAFCCFFVYLFLIILSTFNSQLCVPILVRRTIIFSLC